MKSSLRAQHVFERLSGIDLGGTLASVPSSWLMSRQEIVLLSNWTDPANDSWWLRAAWRFEGLPAVLLIVGIWAPVLIRPPAAIVAVLMIGALAMHAKVRDPLTKSLPAFLMLVMCVAIIWLQS